MKKLLLSGVAFLALSSAAFAADIGGEVTVDIAETATGKWGSTMGLELNVKPTAATGVALGFVAQPNNSLTLDTWSAGTTLGPIELTLGNDNSVFVEAEGEQTIAAPAMSESVKLAMGDAAVAVGFTNWTSDITDISNIQGSYTTYMGPFTTTLSADYNLNAEDFVVGSAISGLNVAGMSLGSVVTYENATSAIGYELIAKTNSITAYVNGDDSDALQNIGGKYDYSLGNFDLSTSAVYNLDAKDVTPTVGLTFTF